MVYTAQFELLFVFNGDIGYFTVMTLNSYVAHLIKCITRILGKVFMIEDLGPQQQTGKPLHTALYWFLE